MTKGKKFIIVGLSTIMAAAMAIGIAGCGETAPTLEAVPAKEASCEYDGNTAYWKDPATGKCYSDAEGQNEIAESDTVIAATGHSYSDTWSSDGTNHWHQATCEHSDKLKDRAEHKYLTWSEVSQKEGFTGKEVLACTVCGHERSMTEAYQMYVIGRITSCPNIRWDNRFVTKADCSQNCPPMTYDEATGTFSAELILAPGDLFAIYNLAEGRKFPASAADASTQSLKVQTRSTYVISWKPTDGNKVTVEEHEHKFNNNYKFSGAEHWIECDDNDGAIKPDSNQPHDLESGACVCGFSPENCKHEEGYVFDYHTWEGGTPAPDPEAEGGTLKKVCPYCFKEETVNYDVGYSANATSAIEDLSKTYYLKGQACGAVGLHFTEPGVYTLSFEVVCDAAKTPDQINHHAIKVICYSPDTALTSSKIMGSPSNEQTSSRRKCLWCYNSDGSPWFEYSDTYEEMQAAVAKWKTKIVINNDPDYHYDKETQEMVNLNTITFTIEESDLGENGIYFGFSMSVGTSMGSYSKDYALLAKVTKSAPAAAASLPPQEIALLPTKKTY